MPKPIDSHASDGAVAEVGEVDRSVWCHGHVLNVAAHPEGMDSGRGHRPRRLIAQRVRATVADPSRMRSSTGRDARPASGPAAREALVVITNVCAVRRQRPRLLRGERTTALGLADQLLAVRVTGRG